MKVIQLRNVEDFVKHILKDKLQTDLRSLRILKEADVECCAYYHLRRFLKSDSNWKVFARKYSPKTGYYTDLVIFHGMKEKIAIEIKWGRRRISKKDRKALGSARKNMKVKKTYFYSVLPDGSSYMKVRGKAAHERYRMFERVVDLGYKTIAQIEKFRKERRGFRVGRTA